MLRWCMLMPPKLVGVAQLLPPSLLASDCEPLVLSSSASAMPPGSMACRSAPLLLLLLPDPPLLLLLLPAKLLRIRGPAMLAPSKRELSAAAAVAPSLLSATARLCVAL
jgi:hypothetical protein